MFLCESKSTLFGLPKVDAIRNHWLRFVYNTTAQPKCLNLLWTTDSFVNLVEYKAGYARRLFLKKKGQFRLCYDNLVLLNKRLSMFCY